MFFMVAGFGALAGEMGPVDAIGAVKRIGVAASRDVPPPINRGTPRPAAALRAREVT